MNLPGLPQAIHDHPSNADYNSDEANGNDEEDRLNKKPRIPWDRNPRGDRNNLKFVLLSCINDGQLHVKGKFRDNFKQISQILSQENSPFSKYRGIEPSGAQRKFNSVIREVAKTLRLQENGEFDFHDGEMVAFEALAAKMLRDIMEKEKHRRTEKRGSMLKAEGLGEPAITDEYGEELASFLVKKRKSDVNELKQTMRKAAAVMLGDEPDPTIGSNGPTMSQIHRLDTSRHSFVLSELQQMNPPIHTVGELLQRAEVSAAGIAAFAATTGIQLDKPVDRLLKIYEEVASSLDYTAQMKTLCGILPGDALEFEYFIKPLYTNILQG